MRTLLNENSVCVRFALTACMTIGYDNVQNIERRLTALLMRECVTLPCSLAELLVELEERNLVAGAQGGYRATGPGLAYVTACNQAMLGQKNQVNVSKEVVSARSPPARTFDIARAGLALNTGVTDNIVKSVGAPYRARVPTYWRSWI